MTKDEAHQEAVRRWQLLPDDLRLSYEAADAFAQILAGDLQFTCYTSPDQLIAAWLIRAINAEKQAIAEASRAA